MPVCCSATSKQTVCKMVQFNSVSLMCESHLQGSRRWKYWIVRFWMLKVGFLLLFCFVFFFQNVAMVSYWQWVEILVPLKTTKGSRPRWTTVCFQKTFKNTRLSLQWWMWMDIVWRPACRCKVIIFLAEHSEIDKSSQRKVAGNMVPAVGFWTVGAGRCTESRVLALITIWQPSVEVILNNLPRNIFISPNDEVTVIYIEPLGW